MNQDGWVQLVDTAECIDTMERWTAEVRVENPIVANVERDPEISRWYVRIRGEEKLVTTVWFTVREHTVHVESYFMPSPDENRAETFEYVLRASQRFFGLRMVIGGEDAIYFRGELPVEGLTFAHLDRILGSIYAYSEECFRTAMRIGFATHFVA